MTVHAQRARLTAWGQLEPQVVQDTGLDADTTKGAFSLVDENIIGQAFQQIGSHFFSSAYLLLVRAFLFYTVTG
jgi:hypothetical protein